MTHTAATVILAVTLLIAFLLGANQWHLHTENARLARDLESLERTVGLMLGREHNRDEYEPEDEWAPAEREQPRALWPTGGAEADDQSTSARLLPRLGPTPRRFAEDSEPDPGPATDEIPVCPPTQPDLKAASSVGPLPSVESRAEQLWAEWQRRKAEIGGGL